MPHGNTTVKYFVLISLLALLGIKSISADATAADKVRIGIPDVSGQFVTYPLAQSRGFLKQEGLDAEIVVIRGNVAMAAVVSGDVDYTVGIPQGVRGALLGMPLKVVACFRALFDADASRRTKSKIARRSHRQDHRRGLGGRHADAPGALAAQTGQRQSGQKYQLPFRRRRLQRASR